MSTSRLHTLLRRLEVGYANVLAPGVDLAHQACKALIAWALDVDGRLKKLEERVDELGDHVSTLQERASGHWVE